MARRTQKKEMSLRRMLWIVFLLAVALFIVYLYRLQTQGHLVTTLLKWTDDVINAIKKKPLIPAAIFSYLFVFYIGYLTGKRRHKK